MEIYRGHEQEFSKYISSANRKLNQYNSEGGSDNLLSETRTALSEATKLVNMMENDLYGLGSNEASQLQNKFKKNKETLENLKNQLASAKDKKDREDLMGKNESSKREKMLTNNQILQETGDVLESTNKLAIETEGIGYDALNSLKGQRRQILGIGEKVNDVGANVSKADRIVFTMNNRRICMKIIMMGTIVLLVIAFAICLYIKLG
ncbi:hypothetical protein SteCoe_12705 [Stentor coeruleus]|uniref:Vesicle transport v-SNARE N-terminal domain-containing protein n=1 Tax=Stentor coeruleus TaxID=5963 RepID=A0A1R2CA34_9CILI|nr:hypothetical protein SteCoe_12705 [Stentor coeruleus]